MMKKHVFSCAGAVICAVALTSAQSSSPQTTPQGSSPQSSSPQTASSTPSTSMDQNQGQAVTLTGCLAREKDVAGMQPNVAERAGIGEDYILTNVSMAGSSAGYHSGATSSSSGSKSTTGSTASTGSTMSGTQTGQTASATSTKMYKIEGLDDSRLQPFVGQRVEVTGKMKKDVHSAASSTSNRGTASGTTGTSSTDSSTGTMSSARSDVPEFEATSIRKAPTGGSCPAPANR
jgi:hypothetical protein